MANVPTLGEPAGFWIRAVATLVDSIFLFVAQTFVEGRLGIASEFPAHMPEAQVLAHLASSLAVGLLLGGLYESIMIGRWGGTIGKLIFGLRVVRGDGGRVTYGLALTRSFAEIVSFLALGLGYLWVALSPSKRAWHDYLCDTRVVHRRPG